jgi:hypothetical protein
VAKVRGASEVSGENGAQAALEENRQGKAFTPDKEMSARCFLWLAVLLPLAACDKPKPSEEPPARNQWQIVPAGQHTVDGTTEYGAWRINTATGEIDFCSYAPSGSQGTPTCSGSVNGF